MSTKDERHARTIIDLTEKVRDLQAKLDAIEYRLTRWWRVLTPEGTLWCETSDEAEARASMRPGDRLQRWYEAYLAEWRDTE